MIMSVQNKKSSTKKKSVTLGVVHIQATFNNTIVTFSDIYGNVISTASAGEPPETKDSTVVPQAVVFSLVIVAKGLAVAHYYFRNTVP